MEARIGVDYRPVVEKLDQKHTQLQQSLKTSPAEAKVQAKIFMREVTEAVRVVNEKKFTAKISADRVFFEDAYKRLLGYSSFWYAEVNRR